MGLDMNDFVKYVNEFKSMQAEFDEFLKNWITKQGNIVLADTKENTPVDTGNLRNSWSLGNYQQQGNKAQIGINNSAEYASFVEYGTPKRPNWKWADGARMMTKAIYNRSDKMPEDFDKAFAAFLKSKGLT